MVRGSAAADDRPSLCGRAEECARLEALAGDVLRGQSRSLVLLGEAGIGKTALLEHLTASASDSTVLRTVGVESDMELAYAGLHQLCGPVLDRLASLPEPQRAALEVVFGLSAGPAPDRFLVGLGVLSLLSGAAEERALLCIVDDAQWLDQASALTLAFVARRLLVERIGIMFATRQWRDELTHLPELELTGLVNGDARALLQSAVRFRLDESVRDRIVAETRGNPLALLELPRGLTAAELAGLSGAPERYALTGRIEESFIRRLEALPEPTRLLLLAAAAEPVGDPLLLRRAAERLGIEPGAAVRAADEGLLAIDARVVFRHPLVRSAVYGSAMARDRIAVHAALAEATDRDADPDRRAWHLAAATTGPDEAVAAELERSAARAQARGGVAAAAACFKRSAALTEDPARRARRAIAAAEAHLQAGAFDAALELLAGVATTSLDELGRARVELLRGQIAFGSTGGGDAPALLLHAAKRIEPLDLALARDTYLDAWGAALLAGRFAGAGSVREVSRAARSVPQPALASRPSDLLLDGFSLLVMEGRAAAAPALSEAVRAFAQEEIGIAETLRWGWLAPWAAWTMWDHQSWRQIMAEQLQSVRDAGFLGNLPVYLNSLGASAAWRGDHATAASMTAEADAIAEVTGTGIARYAAVVLAAFRGDEAELSSLVEVELRTASATGQGFAVQVCEWMQAVLYNGLGRYEEACEKARSASTDAPELWVSAWALPELIEAATRVGQPRLAAEALERLTEATSVGDSDWGLGITVRSRALLSEGDAAAEGLHREAIERLRRSEAPSEFARAHLLYGEWLRREGRRAEARDQLRTAYELFVAIGMEAFAERARHELLATGETVRRRAPETREALTPREAEIARLAADGLTNPEIGTRLFISPRTVEYHLHKVFGKLGVSSRRDLRPARPG